MASKSEHPAEGNPEYGDSFTREEITALAAFFHGLGIKVDLERMGELLDTCELIGNSFAKSGISLGGSPGRAISKARQVKELMMSDLTSLIETVLPVSADETLQDYLYRSDVETLKFPLDVRAAMVKPRLSPYLEQGEQMREHVPNKSTENPWLGTMERLAALYEYCRQISQMPEYREDESRIQEAEQLSRQYRKQLTEQGVLFRKADRDISDMVILQTAIVLNKNGKA